MSGSMALGQLGSVWKSLAHVASKGYKYAKSLDCYLCLCSYLRTAAGNIQIWVSCVATYSHGVVQAQAAAESHVCVHALQQPTYDLIYMVPVTTKGCEVTGGLFSHLGSGWSPMAILKGSIQICVAHTTT